MCNNFASDEWVLTIGTAWLVARGSALRRGCSPVGRALRAGARSLPSFVRHLARMDALAAFVGLLSHCRRGPGNWRSVDWWHSRRVMATPARTVGCPRRLGWPGADRHHPHKVGETTPYPGTAALLPVLGTALVMGAGRATPDLGVGHFLSAPAMRAVVRLSYSWYL